MRRLDEYFLIPYNSKCSPFFLVQEEVLKLPSFQTLVPALCLLTIPRAFQQKWVIQGQDAIIESRK